MSNEKEPKEVQQARQHLQPGETILQWTNGLCESTMLGKETKRNGVLLATDRRVVIYISKMLGGYELEEFPYESLSSIETGKGWTGHTLKLIASNNNSRVSMMKQGDPQAFIEHVRQQVGRKTAAPPPIPATSPADDLMSKLERLADLRTKNLLTEDEFTQAKAKLLQM